MSPVAENRLDRLTQCHWCLCLSRMAIIMPIRLGSRRRANQEKAHSADTLIAMVDERSEEAVERIVNAYKRSPIQA